MIRKYISHIRIYTLFEILFLFVLETYCLCFSSFRSVNYSFSPCFFVNDRFSPCWLYNFGVSLFRNMICINLGATRMPSGKKARGSIICLCVSTEVFNRSKKCSTSITYNSISINWFIVGRNINDPSCFSRVFDCMCLCRMIYCMRFCWMVDCFCSAVRLWFRSWR